MEKSEFIIVKEFLNDRFKAPLKSISFLLYFFIVIILVGLFGSFISILDTVDFSKSINFKSLSMSLVGYGVVLLSSSSIELIFIRLNSEEEEKFNYIKKAISMIGVSLIIVSLFMALLVYSISYEYLKFSISIILCLTALYFWWVTNARTLSVLNLINPPNKENATGGDATDADISGKISSEYKV